jgi:chromosome segregation ATPase
MPEMLTYADLAACLKNAPEAADAAKQLQFLKTRVETLQAELEWLEALRRTLAAQLTTSGSNARRDIADLADRLKISPEAARTLAKQLRLLKAKIETLELKLNRLEARRRALAARELAEI